MTRDEKYMSPQAAALLKSHWRIGYDRGLREGSIPSFFIGVFATLALLFVLAGVL